MTADQELKKASELLLNIAERYEDLGELSEADSNQLYLAHRVLANLRVKRSLLSGETTQVRMFS